MDDESGEEGMKIMCEFKWKWGRGVCQKQEVIYFNFRIKLEMRSVERDICPIATSIMNELNCSNDYGRMHCACAKRPYFHFR